MTQKHTGGDEIKGKIAFISEGDYIYGCSGFGITGICEPRYPHGLVPEEYPLDDEEE
jgi:hypothetical protein